MRDTSQRETGRHPTRIGPRRSDAVCAAAGPMRSGVLSATGFASFCRRPLYFLRQGLYFAVETVARPHGLKSQRGKPMPESNRHVPTSMDSTARPTRSKAVRLILVSIGIGLVALGVLGIFLPVMPTTIFLLLAAGCFVRSSDRLHHWLREHRILGPYLDAVEGRSGMPRKAKISTLVVLWISILSSAFLFVDMLWLRGVLLAIACGVSIFIISRPTINFADRPAGHIAGDSDKPDRQETAACRKAECT